MRVLREPLGPQDLLAAGEAIAEGAVVVYPTDTLYALGGSAFSESVAARIAGLKGRPEGKGFPLVVADAAQAFAELLDPLGRGRLLAGRFWPGPLTIVLPVREASRLVGAARQGGGAALRVPAHSGARALAAAAGGPLVATSANRSGEPAPSRVEDIATAILGGVDLLVDGGPCAGGPPSTIVDLAGEAPAIVREGAVAAREVLGFLEP